MTVQAGLIPVSDGLDSDIACSLACGFATGGGAIMNTARSGPGVTTLWGSTVLADVAAVKMRMPHE